MKAHNTTYQKEPKDLIHIWCFTASSGLTVRQDLSRAALKSSKVTGFSKSSLDSILISEGLLSLITLRIDIMAASRQNEVMSAPE